MSEINSLLITTIQNQINTILISLLVPIVDYTTINNGNNSLKLVNRVCNRCVVIDYTNVNIQYILNSSPIWIQYLTTQVKKVVPNNAICSTPTELIRSWIVTFKPGFNPTGYRWPQTLRVTNVYNNIYNGMSCLATESQMTCLDRVNVVEYIVLDQIMSIEPVGQVIAATATVVSTQATGAFITRIGANHSSQKSGNGSGSLAARTDINVFVVDTGIAYHTELNIVGGRNFTTTNINGWIDDNGHGTHVAGIIGAKDNNVGIAGVAPGVRLWAIKVLTRNGIGLSSNIIAGLNWIYNNRQKIWAGRGIVNMSMGGAAFAPLDTAVNGLINAGIIVCVAAGNSAANANNYSPARVPNAITVGATAPIPLYNTLAVYSNWGPRVDILAPGSNILSTYLNNGYAFMTGTSMASPILAGTAALLTSVTKYPGGNTLTYSLNIRNAITNGSTVLRPKNYDGTIGTNPRIIIPIGKPTTNVSVWAGKW
jgi:subtilisin family serine protease